MREEDLATARRKRTSATAVPAAAAATENTKRFATLLLRFLFRKPTAKRPSFDRSLLLLLLLLLGRRGVVVVVVVAVIAVVVCFGGRFSFSSACPDLLRTSRTVVAS